jgi:MSHA biogenesis protein MshO
MMAKDSQRGFTLVELVVTMVISVVVVSFVSVFISGPVVGFTDQARRAGLSDAADGALNRLSRDVRRALPNSVRITSSGGVQALELMSSVDGARYRRSPPGTSSQILDFSIADDAFNSIGSFTQIAKPFVSVNHYLAIYNVGVPGADAYALTDVITPAGTQITITDDTPAGEDRISLVPAFRFAYESPRQRLFLVDTPVTYLCNPGAASLRRYANYPVASSQADRDTAVELLAAGAVATLVADQVTGCAFSYTPGTAERAALVTLRLSIGAQGESVSLLRQIHVDNAP